MNAPLIPALAHGATPEPTAPTAPTAPPLPGLKAMWVGVCLEYIEFTVFFVVYFVSRWHHPQAFQEGAARLWTTAGMLITAAMLTSGYLLTRAVAHMKLGRLKTARTLQALALLVGLCYPVAKALEWQWNTDHGINASAGIFVVVYYYLTINHFIHACWGLLGMGWCLARAHTGAYSQEDHRGLEALATYWHATDLVWLMIFALFYAFA